MKNIVDRINEGVNNSKWETGIEGSTVKGADMLNCRFGGNKKRGFLCWNSGSETVSLVATDSAEEFADALSLTEKDVEYMFDIAKYGTFDDGDEHILRIW
jgi:hypothetical protein